MSFELIWGYCHCFGKTVYHEGLVGTEAEARHWVKARCETVERLRAPRQDPVVTCPVAACPGHRQRPWFDYRPVTEMQGEAS